MPPKRKNENIFNRAERAVISASLSASEAWHERRYEDLKHEEAKYRSYERENIHTFDEDARRKKLPSMIRAEENELKRIRRVRRRL